MDRTNKENDTLLPDINERERGSRRRAAGGMIGGVSKAGAGFKSDFNSTGNYAQTKGGVVNYDFGAAGGLGSGLVAPKKAPPVPPSEPSQMPPPSGWSPSKKARLQQALKETEIKQERPPLYVPQQRRDSVTRRETEGYQPSLLQRKSSTGPVKAQEPVPTHTLMGPVRSGSNAMGSSERRYR